MFNEKITRRSFLTISAMTASFLALDWEKISAYAAKLGPKDQYPTAVIGAGLGGLSCAAYLARQGIPVNVLEQHDIPGGYATSFERAKGKFSFEVSLHGSSINNNATARILRDLGVLEKLQLVECPEVYSLKTPTLDLSAPSRDPEAFIRLLSHHFPQEKEGLRGFITEIIAIAEEGNRLHQKKGRVIKPLFPVQYPHMWKVRDKTLAQLLDAYIKAPALRHCLTALWGYYGLPPSKLSGFYFANATGEYLKSGSFYIKPNSQALSNALVEVIEAAGGKVLFDTKVEKILVKSGRVQGVSLANGKVLPARAVVSNASALRAFQEMLPREVVPAEYLTRLQKYRPSISSFIVWLGLNKELRGQIKGYGIQVQSNQGPEADYQSALKGEIDQGSFSVALYNNLFEDYSPPGTTNLMLLFLCGYEPWRKFEADYLAGRKEAYTKEKERWADILIKRAEERVIPSLSSMIEVREAATPLTNRRFTGNPEGAIYGFEQSLDNAFMNRIENRTPIKGLYLSSAWGFPGGGYAGVLRAGETTFQNMMEDWGA
jgi:phytoene dehydrogenase-like protein